MSEQGGNTAVESILANPLSLLITEPAPEYGTGRRCAHDGCITTLSRYHPGDYCYSHADDEWDPRTVAMAYTKEGLRPCSKCGRVLSPNLREFYSDTKSKDGLSAECISCQNPARAEKERQNSLRAGVLYRQRHGDRIRAHKRAVRG